MSFLLSVTKQHSKTLMNISSKKNLKTKNKENLHSVFDQLKSILQKFEPRLLLKVDKPGSYSIDAPYSEKYKKELFFGAAQVKKNYVSYYLFPVYMFPELLKGISPGLKKRMQGKSCFNFTSIDKELLSELKQLTKSGFERFKKEKLV
jgi:hypothetical protein